MSECKECGVPSEQGCRCELIARLTTAEQENKKLTVERDDWKARAYESTQGMTELNSERDSLRRENAELSKLLNTGCNENNALRESAAAKAIDSETGLVADAVIEVAQEKEIARLTRELGEARKQAHGTADGGVADCGHNRYWTTFYGRCMACMRESAEARCGKMERVAKDAIEKLQEFLDCVSGKSMHSEEDFGCMENMCYAAGDIVRDAIKILSALDGGRP